MEIISSYTRKQAIEDGVLVDCPPAIRAEAGFIVPIAFTNTVWAMIEAPCDDGIHSLNGVLWDVLYMLRLASKKNGDANEVKFSVFIWDIEKKRDILHNLKAVIGPGDDPRPVLTVMLPNED